MRWTTPMGLALAAGCAVEADYDGTRYRCGDGACPPGQTCVAGFCAPPGGGDGAPPDGAHDAAPDAPAPPVDAAPDAAAPPSWWDPSFPDRRQLVVTNLDDAAPLPDGFQVVYRVDVDQLVTTSSSYGALRVVFWDGAAWTELDRFIDDTGESVEGIWFALQAAIPAGGASGDYWIYHDHPAPTAAPSSGSAIFDYYEAFSTSSVSVADWVIGGTPTTASGVLVLDPLDEILSRTTWGPGFAVDFTLTVPTWGPRFWGGFQQSADLMPDEPWAVWISRTGGASPTIWPEFLAYATGETTTWEGTAIPLLTDRRIYGVDRLADRILYRYEDVVIEEHAIPTFTTPMSIRLTNDGTAQITCGFTRVRQTHYPFPTVALGLVETL
jgi:hypothetical protein